MTSEQEGEPYPPRDPTKPPVPVSYPIKTLKDLESRSYFQSFHYPFNKASVALQSGSSSSLPNRPRLLVCHDMQGGYLDDKWVQGGTNPEAYVIWHWYLIDVFVYFSHSLVTIPPPCWINTAHRHGVKGLSSQSRVEGRVICNKLLSTKKSARMYAERLTELAVKLGFDGWLLNMEVGLDSGQIPNLKEFVSHLNQTMHSSAPGSLVIWYDSVTIHGYLRCQSQLNELNKPFFDICDGIFVDYHWGENYPSLSASVAGDRKYDVYMGIDVFERGTYGRGEWKTKVTLDVLKKKDVSAAIFAPGWVYENKEPPDFQTAQNRWWALVEKSWRITQNYPKVLPFYTNFDQGHGYHFAVDGAEVSDKPSCNISCQGFQPLLDFADNATPNTIQTLVDFKEASYSGGGSITFKRTLEDDAFTTRRLFHGELPLEDLPIHLTYSVKLEGDPQLGLSLLFSSAMNERVSILLATSEMTQFSSKFSNVITTTPQKTETVPGWVVQDASIPMNHCKLTDIDAVCYRSKNELDRTMPTHSSVEYRAVLGHISIKTSEKSSHFPPSSSWLVEGEFIKWTPGSLGSKTFSAKIVWKLNNGTTTAFHRYNIYAKKLAKQEVGNQEGTLAEVEEYLGTAHVEAFYVSDLAVPSGTSSLKFIVQVCSVDGTCLKLDSSPTFSIGVEDL